MIKYSRFWSKLCISFVFLLATSSSIHAQSVPLLANTSVNNAPIINQAYNPASCGGIAPPPTWCSGSDIGAWVNAAIAALGGQSATGVVEIPAGTYSQTTTIVKPRAIILRGQGTGTLLNYTGSGIQIQVVDDTGPDSFFAYLGGIQNIHLHGPSNTSGTSLYFGCNLGSSSACTNYYGDNQFIRDVVINDFGTGIKFGSNAFLLHFQNFGLDSQITTGIATDSSNNVNSGENIEFVGGQMSATEIAVKTWPLHFVGTSFDVAPTAATPTFSNTSLQCVNCHFEALGGTGPIFSTNSGSALTYVNGEIFYDQTTVTVPYAIYSTGSFNSIAVSGTDLSSGATATSFINANSGASQNISIHGLQGSGFGGGTVLQSGFNLNQTGVNVEVNGNWGTSSSANYQQYVLGSTVALSLQGGATELASSSGTLGLTPNAGGYTAYLTSSSLSLGSAAYNTNVGYQIAGATVIPSTATGYHGTNGTKVQLSDATGTSGYLAKFSADGSVTSGPSLGGSNSIVPTESGTFVAGDALQANSSSGDIADSGFALSKVPRNCGTMTTTASASNSLACSWVSVSSNCTVTPSNSTSVAWTYFVPSPGTVTVYHAATAGATYAIACSGN